MIEVKVGITQGFFLGILGGFVGGTTLYTLYKQGFFSRKALLTCSTNITRPSHYNKERSTKSEPEPEHQERAEERDAFWYSENVTESFGLRLVLRKILFETRSPFQLIQVVETEQFGKTLILDGQTQSALADEHVYHETLVHTSMLMHPNPKRVFIGGGGEFATAREVLRHKTVQEVVMIDIDKVTCDTCREHLPEWNSGAYDDKRFRIEYMDARQWLEEHEEKFDVIILDICDPIEAGPGYKLYTQDFYSFLKSRLNETGIVVTQSGPAAVYNIDECFTVINRTLQSSYNCVIPYIVDVPSFGCNWGFNMAIVNKETEQSVTAAETTRHRILETSIGDIDQAIEKRIDGDLKYFDGITFKGVLGVGKTIRQACEEETRIMTLDNPVFMYSQ